MTKLNKFAKQIAQFSITLIIIFAVFFSAVSTATAQSWQTLSGIMSVLKALEVEVDAGGGADGTRNTAIVFLMDHTNESVGTLQGLNNEQILESLHYVFYLMLRNHKKDWLKTLSVGNLRNGTISYIHTNKGTDVNSLYAMNSSALLLHDGINVNNLDAFFGTSTVAPNSSVIDQMNSIMGTSLTSSEVASSTESLFKFNPSATECTTYENAKNSLPGLEQSLASARAEYNEIVGKIESVLNEIRKIPGAKFVYDLAKKTNPLLKEYENQKRAKATAITNTEHNLLAAQNVLNNRQIIERCKMCKESKESHQRIRDELKKFSKFVDAVGERRAIFMQGGNPNNFGTDLDNFNSVVFQSMRYDWSKRNESLGTCN